MDVSSYMFWLTSHQAACSHSIVLHDCVDVSSYQFWFLIFNQTDHNSSVSHCREKFRTANCIVQVHPVYATDYCCMCNMLWVAGYNWPQATQLPVRIVKKIWITSLGSSQFISEKLCALPWVLQMGFQANIAATIIGVYLWLSFHSLGNLLFWFSLSRFVFN